jgi:hypothetical protein
MILLGLLGIALAVVLFHQNFMAAQPLIKGGLM